MVVFTEVEHEEIINEFLNYIEQQETKIVDDFLSDNDNKIEEEDDSYGFVTEKRLEKETTEHHKTINQKFHPIKTCNDKIYGTNQQRTNN